MRAQLLALMVLVTPGVVLAQRSGGNDEPLPTIEETTEDMRRMDGFFPLYWDEDQGRLMMEIARFDTELLHLSGLGAGLGSNDIGLDRGQLHGSRIVEFERVGRKILMVEPNYRFRATSNNPEEVKAVTDAFARSVLWGFTVIAQTGDRALVDLTDFLIRDPSNIAERLRPGTYRLEASRSAVYMPMTAAFPENTEMEAELTFVRQSGGGFGGPFFEGVSDVAATGEAASLRVHHSFVQLPDDGYTPREYDPRAGYGAITYEDYATPLGQPMTKRFIRRHRLEKVDASAPVSEPVEPIIYYLDPGTPEPVRSALLDGARWWNQAFEAAGYRNAFRVEIRPDSISPLDIRYNVINWVHRSTRGWSYGASVTDPRTGEIIKGSVTLGSLRIRQDYLIAEGLLSPYEDGTEDPEYLAEWALARIRQLSAHEVAHTIGLAHNYYDSRLGRISVVDYPHPLVTLRSDGSLDYSDVYENGIGEWDSVAVAYGYQDFPDGTDEHAALQQILNDAWDRDIRLLTNQDIDAHPLADQWSNGTDAAAELTRMLNVRHAALQRFGERAIRRGRPLATIEEALVPLYLHHRYQVDAAASVLGGVDYIYAMRGDGRRAFRRASAEQQTAALDALMSSLSTNTLALPTSVLDVIPPRPMGYGMHRELFPRYTGEVFDAITPATVAAQHTVSTMLREERAARMVEQHALDPSLPGLETVVDALLGTFDARPGSPYEAEINRAVERVIADQLMRLAESAEMPQVRAITTLRLERLHGRLNGMMAQANDGDAAHYHLLAADIERFVDRHAEPAAAPEAPVAPPGAPIGEPAMEWLRALEPICVTDGPLYPVPLIGWN